MADIEFHVIFPLRLNVREGSCHRFGSMLLSVTVFRNHSGVSSPDTIFKSCLYMTWWVVQFLRVDWLVCLIKACCSINTDMMSCLFLLSGGWASQNSYCFALMWADEKRMTACCLIHRDLMPGPRRLYCFGNGFNGFSKSKWSCLS